MATFQKRGSSTRAIVRKLGVHKSQTFPTGTAARAWAAITEAAIVAGKFNQTYDKTFGDLLRRYADEVSPTKDGQRWELLRINKYLREPMAAVRLSELNSTHFAKWRDDQLKEVEAGTVLREWNLLSNALKRARDEWGWMIDNPLKPVAKPKKPPPRTRIATQEEVERMLHCAGYRDDLPLTTATLRVFAGYQFAMETALRAGELCALEWVDVFLDKGYLRVAGIKPGARKNNAAVRDVPLTFRAIELLHQVKLTHCEGLVFSISISSLDSLFRKVRDRAGIADLTFHDTRHAAITMLAQHYDVLALARIVGHTNIKELMTYYNPTIADLVGKLRK